MSFTLVMIIHKSAIHTATLLKIKYRVTFEVRAMLLDHISRYVMLWTSCLMMTSLSFVSVHVIVEI